MRDPSIACATERIARSTAQAQPIFKSAKPKVSESFAVREAALGPSRRWRSPELAAGYWGSSAATVALGPQGQPAPMISRGVAIPQNRASRASHSN
jgi:hypothetical protein